MSFEGYWQVFCTNGHYFTIGHLEQDNRACHHRLDGNPCRAPVIFSNLVDNTNLNEEGFLPLETFKVSHPQDAANDVRYELPGVPCFMCGYRQDDSQMKSVDHYPEKACERCYRQHFS